MLSAPWLKPLAFTACLAPLASLAWLAYHNDLGANPLEFITRSTGDWTLRFLLLSLAITPARRLTGISSLIRFRRMIGLFSFFYAALHLLTYLWFDQFFDTASILKDIARRPFIAAGMAGFLLLLPLALTSTAGWIRRLGGRNWQRLHRLAYLAAIAGVVHYYWLVKSDIRLPLLYAAIAAALLLFRAIPRFSR
jgi:sulfoxide reductase heme-binding subunit YedZ